MVSGTDLSFAVAVGAGLISFLSPCVLPLVPAYLGQLTAIAILRTALNYFIQRELDKAGMNAPEQPS